MKNQVAVKAVVKDLVCGMDVETATAAGQSEHKGHTLLLRSELQAEVRSESGAVSRQVRSTGKNLLRLLQLAPTSAPCPGAGLRPPERPALRTVGAITGPHRLRVFGLAFSFSSA